MIDAHLHAVPPEVSGAGPLHPALLDGPVRVADALRGQWKAAGVRAGLAVGHLGGAADDPLGVASTRRIAELLPGLAVLGAIDPARDDRASLERAGQQLTSGEVNGLFAYLGHLPHGPDHPSFRPWYELAERHRAPVVLHTGTPYSARARLRLCHPLLADDVAIDHPRVNFVLAGLGHPWSLDAAEVVAKNINVWADLAGLATGDAAGLSAPERQEELQAVTQSVRRAFRHAGRPNRFLFGSDWPLVDLPAYAALVAAAVPEIHHPQVFEDNARGLFRLG